MDSFEKALKKNGMLLKSIPAKERTKEQCIIAVHQNPKALKLVPYRLQSESLCKYALKKDPSVINLISAKIMSEKLCLFVVKQDGSLLNKIDSKYKTEKVCRAALMSSIKALQYVPKNLKAEIYPEATVELVVSCLDWIKQDLMASVYLPECVKTNHNILNYQKTQQCLQLGMRYYDPDTDSFKVQLHFYYHPAKGDPVKYPIVAEYVDFDEFYNFLDGNLNGAALRKCSFERIDLHQYNISGAVIHSDVLLRQGLYDDTFFQTMIAGADQPDSLTGKNELALQKEFHYVKPAEVEGHSRLDLDKIPVFYVSDIHLWHRIRNHFKERATREEVHWYIGEIAEKMVASIGTVPYNSFLLIAGDTSDVFEFSEVFFTKLVNLWQPEHIVVISGNHELWDPKIDMEANILFHRDFFKKLGINYLQNDLLCIEDGFLHQFWLAGRHHVQPYTLNEDMILAMPSEELYEKLYRCPLLILGGIGFSGLNEEYNASNLDYGFSFKSLSVEETRNKDIAESKRFEAIYKKLMSCVSRNRLIVLTHMRKYDWTEAPYVPGWIYVNGHNHRNFFMLDDQHIIYADNQIGYHTEKVGLKYFFTGSDYDIFANYEDGIYQITTAQYSEFNRGKRISCSINRPNITIHMLKKNGSYMFLYYGKYTPTSKQDNLYLLNGGVMRRVDQNFETAIHYYYENMSQYVTNVHNLIDRYTGAQNRISNFIKNLGGSGKIHGCIIDVDMPTDDSGYSYTHLFLNPIDGTVTPYYARDVRARIVYKDFRSLLENQARCENLLANYKELEEKQPANLPVIRYGTSVAEWGEDDSVYDEGGFLYQISRIIKSLQYCSEKNIIRAWNENLLNHSFVERTLHSYKAEDMMNEKLISVP